MVESVYWEGLVVVLHNLLEALEELLVGHIQCQVMEHTTPEPEAAEAVATTEEVVVLPVEQREMGLITVQRAVPLVLLDKAAEVEIQNMVPGTLVPVVVEAQDQVMLTVS